MVLASSGIAYMRHDKYSRGYVYVQIGELGRTYRFHLFPNSHKAAKHDATTATATHPSPVIYKAP